MAITCGGIGGIIGVTTGSVDGVEEILDGVEGIDEAIVDVAFVGADLRVLACRSEAL